MTFCCCLGWRFERCARFEGCRVCLEISPPDPCPAVTRASSLGIPSPEETSSAVASKGPVCCCQREGRSWTKSLAIHMICQRNKATAMQIFVGQQKLFCINWQRYHALFLWPDQNLNYTFNNWLIIYLATVKLRSCIAWESLPDK